MKRIAWLIMVVSFFMTSSVLAQLKDFDLSTYKLPELKTRKLQLSLYERGNYNMNNDLLPVNDQTLTKTSYNNGQMILAYSLDQNSNMFQRTFYVSLDGEYNYQNSKHTLYDQYMYTFDPEFNLRAMNRKFFKSGSFLETGINMNTASNYVHRYRILPDETVNELTYSYQKEFKCEIPLRLGKGRIERIDDARHAIYILEAQEEADRLDRDVNDQDILDLAALMSTLRAARVFDTRLSHMSNLKDINEFLISRGLVSNADATYFVHLDDMMRYGYNTPRYSGKKMSFLIQPGAANENHDNNISNTYTNQKEMTLDAGIEFRYEKPFNLSWQERINAYVYGGVCNNKSITSSDTISNIANVVNYRFGMEHTFGFYPNSRTEMELFYSIDYANIVATYDKNWEQLLRGGDIIHGELGTSIEYYISPKLSINASLSLRYSWIRSESRIYANFGSTNSSDYTMSSYASQTDNHDLYSILYFRLNYAIF